VGGDDSGSAGSGTGASPVARGSMAKTAVDRDGLHMLARKLSFKADAGAAAMSDVAMDNEMDASSRLVSPFRLLSGSGFRLPESACGPRRIRTPCGCVYTRRVHGWVGVTRLPRSTIRATTPLPSKRVDSAMRPRGLGDAGRRFPAQLVLQGGLLVYHLGIGCCCRCSGRVVTAVAQTSWAARPAQRFGERIGCAPSPFPWGAMLVGRRGRSASLNLFLAEGEVRRSALGGVG
jgi:hypothetical protein